MKALRGEAPRWGGFWNRADSLEATHSSAPSSRLSPPSHLKGGGVPSGLCTRHPPSSPPLPAHTFFPEPLYPMADFPFLGTKRNQGSKRKLARRGSPQCKHPSPNSADSLKTSCYSVFRSQIASFKSSTSQKTMEGREESQEIQIPPESNSFST